MTTLDPGRRLSVTSRGRLSVVLCFCLLVPCRTAASQSSFLRSGHRRKGPHVAFVSWFLSLGVVTSHGSVPIGSSDHERSGRPLRPRRGGVAALRQCFPWRRNVFRKLFLDLMWRKSAVPLLNNYRRGLQEMAKAPHGERHRRDPADTGTATEVRLLMKNS